MTSMSELPGNLAEKIREKIAQLSEEKFLSPFDFDAIKEEEQGCSPDWYGEPNEFLTLKPVGAYLDLSDLENDPRQTEQEILASYLEEESEEYYLDIFPVDDFSEVKIAFIVESRGQWGVWITGVGVFKLRNALEKYLLKTHSLVIAGGKSSLSSNEILKHNRDVLLMK